MKKAGVIICICGLIILPLVSFDLFGAKHLPIPLTVTLLLVSLASIFIGPSLLFFNKTNEQRRKVAVRSLWISIVLILIGLVSSWLHIVGARIEIMLGVFIISLFYGTLTVKNKYEKWKVYARSKYDALFFSLFDFIGVGCLILGFLFKIQHWPLAQSMIIFGILFLSIGILAWNRKFKKEVIFRKETEDKLKDSYAQIEMQHLKLEEKQKEIIDSINYAKRIQQSHMPTEKYIQSVLQRLHKK